MESRKRPIYRNHLHTQLTAEFFYVFEKLKFRRYYGYGKLMFFCFFRCQRISKKIKNVKYFMLKESIFLPGNLSNNFNPFRKTLIKAVTNNTYKVVKFILRKEFV